MKHVEPCVSRINDKGQLTLLFPELKNRGEVSAWNSVKGHHEVPPHCPTLRPPVGAASARATETLMELYSRQFKTPLRLVKDVS